VLANPEYTTGGKPMITKRARFVLLLYSFFIAFLLSSCFRQSQPSNETPTPTLEQALFGDSDLDTAIRSDVLVENATAIEETPATDALDGIELPADPESQLSSQNVLVGAKGFTVYIRKDPNNSIPIRIYTHNETTNISTYIYGGTREISSVAVSGDGNKVIATLKETVDAASDFEVYEFTVTPKTVTQLTTNTTQEANVSMAASANLYVWEGDSPVGVVRRVIFIRDNATLPSPTLTFLNVTTPQTEPSISGNGQFIALMRRSTVNNSYVVTVYNRIANTYLSVAGSYSVLSSPSPSNDGKRVAYLSTGTASYALVLRDVGVTPATTKTILSSTTRLDHPHLTADGNYLTYAQTNATGAQIVYTKNLVAAGLAGTSAGAAPVVSSGSYWQQPAPPPPPPPLTAADIQINGGAAPMVFGAGSFTFDASIFGGTNYQWSFGDGSSASSEFAEKDYATPGKYTVTLSFTDASGQPKTFSTQVAKYDEIHNLPSTRAASGDNKIVFDVEFPLDGFIYEWDTGDGQKVQQPRVEKDYSSATAPGSNSALGFYDVVLNVYDNRQTTPPGITTAATAPVLASTQYTRVNIYHAKPVAKFTAQHSQSIEGIAVAGYAPFTVNFDASSSTTEVGNMLTYEWSFGDGTTSTDAITSKTYEAQGRYLVMLKVKDKYLQEAISRTFVYVLTNRQKILSGFRYPQLTASLQAPDVLAEAQAWEAEALKAGEFATEATDLSTSDFSPQATTFFDDFYPVVTHTSGSILNAIFYPLSGSFVTQGVLTYVNGSQVFPNVTPGVIAAENPVNPSQLWNSILFTSVAVPKPVRDGINSVQVINSSQLFDLKYSGFTGLRVPRVVISILPDEQMPGDIASPMITETTVQLNGKTELMLQVNIRESEAPLFAEFEVPVYAVDTNGSNLTNLDGLFRAKFDNLPDSEVVDGVMVQGKAYIKAKLPLNVYGNGQPIDLTRVRIYANTPSCDGVALYKLPNPVVGGSPTNTTKSIAGCTFVTATFEAPSNTALPAYAYTLPADFDTSSNKIKLGLNSTEAYDNNFKDVPGNVATFVIGFIPILGDSVDLLTQVYNTAVGNEVDPVLATLATGGLILDITTGGIGDFTSIFKGAYRLSLQAAEQGLGGVLALVIKEQAQSLLTGAITARQFIQGLGDRLKTFVDFATPGSGCGILGYQCWGIYDRLALGFKNGGGLLPVDAIKKLDDELASDSYAWMEKSTALNDVFSCPLNFGAINYLVDAEDDIFTAQATRRNNLVCPSKTTGRTKIDTGLTYPGGSGTKKIYFQRPDVAEATITKNTAGAFDDGAAMSVRDDLFDAVKKQGDQRCHIIGKQFGGSGSVFNFFPCQGSLNGGALAQFETALKREVNALSTPSLKLKVTFEYNDVAFPNRPSKMIYEYLDNNNQPINLNDPRFTNPMTFLNP
jgi:PKD domain/DNA/RNA non-specific endonuclease